MPAEEAVLRAVFAPVQPIVQDGVKYRSQERVYRDGVLVYGIGTPIPVEEALRQGVVKFEEVGEDERAHLRRIGYPETPILTAGEDPKVEKKPLPKKKRKGFAEPPVDKMIRQPEVQK